MPCCLKAILGYLDKANTHCVQRQEEARIWQSGATSGVHTVVQGMMARQIHKAAQQRLCWGCQLLRALKVSLQLSRG